MTTVLKILLLAAAILPAPLPPLPPTPGLVPMPAAVIRPASFTNGSAVAVPLSVLLAWDPPADSNVIGNRVYLGTIAGSYTLTNTYVPYLTNFVLSGILTNQPYYFNITWFDCTGTESPMTQEVGFIGPGSIALALHSNLVAVTFMAWSNAYTLSTSVDLTNWTVLTNLQGASNAVTVTTPANTNGFAFFQLQTTATNALAVPVGVPRLVTNTVPVK